MYILFLFLFNNILSFEKISLKEYFSQSYNSFKNNSEKENFVSFFHYLHTQYKREGSNKIKEAVEKIIFDKITKELRMDITKIQEP